MWIYRQNISGTFEIGYLKFDQDNFIKSGKFKQIFVRVDECNNREEAESCVHYLNGGDSKKYE